MSAPRGFEGLLVVGGRAAGRESELPRRSATPQGPIHATPGANNP